MTGVTLRLFFLNPYPYPSTPYPYGEGYSFIMEMQGYIKPTVCQGVYKTMGFFSTKEYKPDCYYKI
jgi:hypothetical protein